jgi:hypothetical protein
LKSKLTVYMKLAFRQKFETIIGLLVFAANIFLSVSILITGHYNYTLPEQHIKPHSVSVRMYRFVNSETGCLCVEQLGNV